MPHIEIYTSQQCPYCVRAKALLKSKGWDYTEHNIAASPEALQQMLDRSGRRTVPQIFIDGEGIGGFDELAKLNGQGKLVG